MHVAAPDGRQEMPGTQLVPSSAGLVARVVQTVIADVRSGALRSTERLPSERAYAARLRVSRNTVTAAYAELEQQGAIRRLRGKGSFLCALPTQDESFSWGGKVSSRANALDEPVLELLARRCADGMPFPLSAGTPSLEIFPKEAYTASVARVLAEHLPSCLAVGTAEGQWVLRETIAGWVGAQPEHVMITAGAQEAIDLLARCLIEPGDTVIVDSPTYPGAMQSFRSAGARLVGWDTAWSLEELEQLLLRFRPKLIFTTPTFQNPTGQTMNLQTRLGLLALARRYRVPVLEDDVYARTGFGSQPSPEGLNRLDTHKQVITVSTFSKMLAPGLRIGWIIAPLYMIKQLALIKMRANLFTGGLTQFVLSDMIRGGAMDSHIARMRKHHGELCAAAYATLQPCMEEGLLAVRQPAGGLYLWCKLLFPVNGELLLSMLESHGLSVAPGVAFHPGHNGELETHLRLCFTAAPKDVLLRGMEVLTQTLRQLRASAGTLHSDVLHPAHPSQTLNTFSTFDRSA